MGLGYISDRQDPVKAETTWLHTQKNPLHTLYFQLVERVLSKESSNLFRRLKISIFRLSLTCRVLQLMFGGRLVYTIFYIRKRLTRSGTRVFLHSALLSARLLDPQSVRRPTVTVDECTIFNIQSHLQQGMLWFDISGSTALVRREKKGAPDS